MISPSKGRYEMLLLQPVGPSLPMTTYIQVNRRTTAHCKAQQCEPYSSCLSHIPVAYLIFQSPISYSSCLSHIPVAYLIFQQQFIFLPNFVIASPGYLWKEVTNAPVIMRVCVCVCVPVGYTCSVDGSRKWYALVIVLLAAAYICRLIYDI